MTKKVLEGEQMTSLKTVDVLQAEGAQVLGEVVPASTARIYQSFYAKKAAALCISGGGIRSAAFALGVIQALATHPRKSNETRVGAPESSLLADFHYLSTVSGGGYIGSWLSAWISRAGWPAVWQNLTGRPGGPDCEPRMLSWLRDYSNYLTPKIGLMSADTWAAAATMVRNLLLNWLVMIPIIALAIILLKWFVVLVGLASHLPPGPEYLFGFVGPGLLALVYALQFTTRNRPAEYDSRATQTQFLLHAWALAILTAILFTFALSLAQTHAYVRDIPWCESTNSLPSAACGSALSLIGALSGAIVYAVAWIVAHIPPRHPRLGDFAAWVVAGAVYGFLVSVGVWIYSNQDAHFTYTIFPSVEIFLVVCFAPWFFFSHLIADTVFVGLSSHQPSSDSDREWLARAAGWHIVIAVGWAIVMIVVFVGSHLTSQLTSYFWTTLAPAGGVSGIVTALLGKSKLTPAQGQAKTASAISLNIILAIAAPIFAVVLGIALSAFIDEIAFGKPLTQTQFWTASVSAYDVSFYLPAEGWWLLFWTLILAAVGGCAGDFINVNRFSLHALYRNRIIRAFLGGSNPNRKPNPFTDFDVHDNLRMAELWQRRAYPQGPITRSRDWRPFHIVNMALNIVSTKKLAWQQRKAESFIATPLYTGSACLNPDTGDIRLGGYRDSRDYGDPHGISVGTAVAISGAAASPNMGYHSSAALAFLLTLFNVRLGWWLGNPGPQGEATFKLEGPRLPFRPLFYEMFGLTTDDKAFVYLSDGGHFENLGLYEMVRRRCRFIVLSDAGCDPKFEFEDLGNACRKISLDLDVDIRFDALSGLKSRDEPEGRSEPGFFALGRIYYPAAQDGASEPGIILYLKPFYRESLIKNVGVRNYAAAHNDFPHQGTENQWFDEPQFESYRALGFEIADRVLSQAVAALADKATITLEDVLTALSKA